MTLLVNDKLGMECSEQAPKKCCAICETEVVGLNYREYQHLIKCAKMVFYSQKHVVCNDCSQETNKIQKSFKASM